MNIVIVGAGIVGYSLAEDLSRQRHQISVVDRDADLCSEMSSKLDVYTVAGPGTSPAALDKAGISSADMLIAVTPHDETNLVCCNFAKQYGVAQRIARVRSHDYTQNGSSVSLEELGVTHVIQPEREVVNNVLQYVGLPGAFESANFHSDNVCLRGYRVSEGMPIANHTLSETTHLAAPAQILIVLIIREGQSITPTGAEHILPGDEIVAIMPSESLDAFRKLVGRPDNKLKKIIISGDSLTATHLAEKLKPLAERIVLIDPDSEHGHSAASALNDVEVLQGDCTNVDTLQEAHIEDTAFFIAAGKDTEDNLMSCLLAKAEGAHEVIALTNTDKHLDLFYSLGIDHILNPRKITVQTIMADVLKVPIGAHLRLRNVDAEVTRFTAAKGSKIVDKPLLSVKALTARSIIVGCVFRGDQVIIPSGGTVIRENDEALVVCQPRNIPLAARLFRPVFSLGG